MLRARHSAPAARSLPRLVAFAFALFLLAAGGTPAATSDVVVPGPAKQPPLWFACCDHGIEAADALFADGTVISDLQTLDAGLAVETGDLTPARAALVRKLNDAGIPTIAWLVLPRAQGYYVNANDAAATAARYEEFEKWSRENGLRWEAVGLDIEPVFDEWQGRAGAIIWRLLKRSFDGGRVYRARMDYAALIRKMQADGHRVQTYQMLYIADERRAGSTILERWFGMVDVRGDEEVLMAYSSFNHKVGSVMVWSYGPDAQMLAVGSTLATENAEQDKKFPPLNWDEFLRDTLVASHFSKSVGVYSLEGCVAQGFLPKLKTVDWSQSVTLRGATVAGVGKFNAVLRGILWSVSHFFYFAAAFVIAVVWLIRRRRQKSKRVAAT